MSQSIRRFRSIAITMLMVALANIAISFAANDKGLMPVLPETPRPKGIMPVLPETPRPRGIMPVLPETPRP